MIESLEDIIIFTLSDKERYARIYHGKSKANHESVAHSNLSLTKRELVFGAFMQGGHRLI